MKELTANARECLDKYLQKVRVRLTGSKALDATEIERDIYEHIERELENVDQPVHRAQLEEVLDRLGAPEQWVPDEELNGWRKIIVRMINGPDDWRLAYICFALFVLGLVLLPIGILFLFPLSFYIARSTMSLSASPEDLGNQKILFFPSLILFYVLATLLILFWPAFFFANLRNDDWWLISGLVFGPWWIFLAVFLLKKPALVEKLFFPFGSLFTEKRLRILRLFGIIALVAGVIASVLLVA
jgi:uncharacterized protein YjeT (DUF2065 family)